MASGDFRYPTCTYPMISFIAYVPPSTSRHSNCPSTPLFSPWTRLQCRTTHMTHLHVTLPFLRGNAAHWWYYVVISRVRDDHCSYGAIRRTTITAVMRHLLPLTASDLVSILPTSCSGDFIYLSLPSLRLPSHTMYAHFVNTILYNYMITFFFANGVLERNATPIIDFSALL